jgi:hypothetical protein
MQKEFESEQMRPLAKAVTKTLEKVRGLVREQVKGNCYFLISSSQDYLSCFLIKFPAVSRIRIGLLRIRIQAKSQC